MRLIPGYRFFKCSCGVEWKTATRDCLSSSGEHCIDPDCIDFTMAEPFGYDPQNFPVDEYGNLKDCVNQESIQIYPPVEVDLFMNRFTNTV